MVGPNSRRPWASLALAALSATAVLAQPAELPTAQCPADSTFNAASATCVCNSGFTGAITWDAATGAYTGACTSTNPAAACGNPAINSAVTDPATGAVKCFCNSGDEIKRVMNGISTIEVGGSVPSQIVASGRDSFPLIVDGSNRMLSGAAFLGAGRVVTIGHEGLLVGAAPGLKQYLLNVVGWASEGSLKTKVIAYESSMSGVAAVLTDAGYTAVQRAGAADLSGADVFITSNYQEYSPAQLSAIHEFVRGGGGLISGGHAWVWSDRNPSKLVINEFPGNKLLAPTGLRVIYTMISGGTYNVASKPALPLNQQACAAEAYLRELTGEANMTASDRGLAKAAIDSALASIDVDHPHFADLRTLAEKAGPIIPTLEKRLSQSKEPAKAMAAKIQTRIALGSLPETTVAHPAAADFPGAVPADAPRIEKTLTIDGNYNGNPMSYGGAPSGSVWRSTGLYAAPGEKITITIGAAYANKGLYVQIGILTEQYWGKDSWPRMPQLVNGRSLTNTTTVAANGFGGPIYIGVPAGNLGPITVDIAGGVEMGWHKQGRDGDAELAAMKQLKAPWFEVESFGIIATMPSPYLAQYTTLEPIHKFWEGVMKQAAALAGFDRSLYKPERVVGDRDLASDMAALHNGYPMYGHMDVGSAFLGKCCSCGILHEIGHNHEWKDLMLPGTGEVVCNVYVAYITEKSCGTIPDKAYPVSMGNSSRLVRRNAFQAGELPDPADWMQGFYMDLYDRFGWGMFEKVFPMQRNRPAAERPANTDTARYQQFLLDVSRTTNTNLVPFYRGYKLPVEPATEATVSNLQAWTNFPMSNMLCGNTNITCDIGTRRINQQYCTVNTNCTQAVCCESVPVPCSTANVQCGANQVVDSQRTCKLGKDCDKCCISASTCGSNSVTCAAGQAVDRTLACTPGVDCNAQKCCKSAVRVRSVAVVEVASTVTYLFKKLKATITLEDGNGALITTTAGLVTGDFNSSTTFNEIGDFANSTKTTSQALIYSVREYKMNVQTPWNTQFCVTNVDYGSNYVFVPNASKDCSVVMFPTACSNREGKDYPYCEYPLYNVGTSVKCIPGQVGNECTYDKCCLYVCLHPGSNTMPCVPEAGTDHNIPTNSTGYTCLDGKCVPPGYDPTAAATTIVA